MTPPNFNIQCSLPETLLSCLSQPIKDRKADPSIVPITVDNSKNIKVSDQFSKKIEYDKFYTKELIANECISLLNLDGYDFVVEPSAGSGNFLNNIVHENKVGLDIQPECSSVLKQDWFTYEIDKKFNNVLIVGNPPFGKRNQMSLGFIEHALTFDNVKTIAFILPDVFHKQTLQSHIPDVFRLKYSNKLPPFSFEFNDVSYDVPCTFFVFDKSIGQDLRTPIYPFRDTNDFVFGTSNNYDFFVMGAAANTVKDSPTALNRGYYIKVREGVDVELVKEKFRMCSWTGFSSASGGVFWLSQSEIIRQYRIQFEND
jgi:hypothetical protein